MKRNLRATRLTDHEPSGRSVPARAAASLHGETVTGIGAELGQLVARLERLPMTSFQRRFFLVIATAWLADQINVALLGFLLVTLRTYFHLSLLLVGVLGATTYLGQLLGNVFAGYAADRWGRRRVFQSTMIVWGLGSILSALSWGILSLLFFRIVVGIGVGGEAPVAQAYLCEFMPAEKRGKYIAYMEGFWSIGYVLSGAIAFILLPVLPKDGFRLVFVVVGLLAVIIFWLRRFIPESPRWLAEKGRFQEAEAELAGIEARVAREYGAPLPAPAPAVVIAGAGGSQLGAIRTLWSGVYLRRTVMAGGLWFFALLGYFGLTTWLTTLLKASGHSATSSIGFVTLISLGGIPGFLVAAYLIERLGRKPSMAIFLLGSASMAYLYGHPVAGLIFVEGFAMQFFFFGMWCVLYAYTPELYPTSVRASGAGWASAFGRVGAIIGPIMVGVVVSGIGEGGVFTLGAASFAIAVLLVLLLGPETRGKVLEEAAGEVPVASPASSPT